MTKKKAAKKIKFVLYDKRGDDDDLLDLQTSSEALKDALDEKEPVYEIDEATMKRWKKIITDYEKLQLQLWNKYHEAWNKIDENDCNDIDDDIDED